jgi:hypothetical protein
LQAGLEGVGLVARDDRDGDLVFALGHVLLALGVAGREVDGLIPGVHGLEFLFSGPGGPVWSKEI